MHEEQTRRTGKPEKQRDQRDRTCGQTDMHDKKTGRRDRQTNEHFPPSHPSFLNGNTDNGSDQSCSFYMGGYTK